LTNYASAEVRQIQGLHTPEAREALGMESYNEVINRDDLLLL
jgi:glutamate 5-kinase